jgi:hypothetical protein
MNTEAHDEERSHVSSSGNASELYSVVSRLQFHPLYYDFKLQIYFFETRITLGGGYIGPIWNKIKLGQQFSVIHPKQ